jgi:hypothetical protein
MFFWLFNGSYFYTHIFRPSAPSRDNFYQRFYGVTRPDNMSDASMQVKHTIYVTHKRYWPRQQNERHIRKHRQLLSTHSPSHTRTITC